MSDKLFIEMYVNAANEVLLERYGCNNVLDVLNDDEIAPEDREAELYEREATSALYCDTCDDENCTCNEIDHDDKYYIDDDGSIVASDE